ncbi:MAG: dihydroorotate dehydrogenase electron transfer subunit [Bacteroidaceae bacterium]|nr:dihydroorotate dehydrogenase electron transfer subunit [Bacteroidaceae bacterium]
MRKRIIDLRVTSTECVGAGCVLLRLRPEEGHLPECRPGQFAQLRVDGPGVFLRRPISIHDVEGDEISFLVQVVGEGTRWLADLKVGDRLNVVMPLGNGFSMPASEGRVLLVGGGVGVAPLLYQGKALKEQGIPFAFLLGARTKDLLLRLDAFRQLGDVYVTTEDGSEGERGFVTQHSQLSASDGRWTMIQTCGPTPMMRAVARYAQERGIPCEVSLENKMACGVGACLCCVQQTTEGHKCVCTDGPVFDAQMIIDN